MFFHRNITTIFITRGKIRSAVFSTGGKVIQEAKTYSWTEKNIQTILKDVASRGPDRTHVVFGEEFSYVTTVVSSGADRKSILEKTKEIIPEELENNWDFRKEKDNAFSPQVVAIKPQVLNFFVTNFEEAGFEVEVIEPQSVALARLLPKSGLFLFIAKDEKLLMGAVRNGTVIATHVSEDKNDTSMLERFAGLVEKKCNAKPERMYLGNQTKFTNKNISLEGVGIAFLNLDPLQAVAIKKHLAGEDSHVLNIATSAQKIAKQERAKETLKSDEVQSSNTGSTIREKVLAVIFILLVVAGGFFIKEKYKSKAVSIVNIEKKQTAVKNELAAVQVEQVQVETPKQEVVPIKKAQDLQILILNGGALPGSAGKIKDLLASKEYLNIEAKNANSSDNLGVVVYYQAPNVDGANKIKADLIAKYPKITIAEGVSEEQKSAEVVIMLGK